MNIVVITGASSGMGREFALQLDRRLDTIDEFWLIARRKERLEQLSGQLRHKTRILPMDLSDPASIDRYQELLAKDAPKIRILVNSSGYGVMGRFEELDAAEQAGMVDLNCRALTQVTYASLPYMRSKSRMIQLASSAAFLPQPGFAVYAASKAYVLSFSRALGRELRGRGILVTAVCPGPVRTEFFDRAEKHGSTLAIKKLTMAEPGRVVKDAIRASAAGREVSVSTPLIKAFYLVTKLLPHSVLLALMSLLK